jgi:hypothetical protein
MRRVLVGCLLVISGCAVIAGYDREPTFVDEQARPSDASTEDGFLDDAPPGGLPDGSCGNVDARLDADALADADRADADGATEVDGATDDGATDADAPADTDGPAPIRCLDDPGPDPCGAGPLLITNGSFEVGLASWTPYNPDGAGSPPIASSVLAPSPDGQRHARITGGRSAHLVQGLSSTVAAGTTICIAFCYRTEGEPAEAFVGLEKNDPGKGYPKSLVSFGSSTEWRFGRYQRVVPADFAGAPISVLLQARTGELRVDRVVVKTR